MLFDTPLSFGLKNQNGLNQRFFELRGQPATQKTYIVSFGGLWRSKTYAFAIITIVTFFEMLRHVFRR